MANEVILENGISIKNGWGEILNGLIGDLFDQDDISAEYNTNLMAKLGLTFTKPLNLEETFDIMVGSGELDEIDEGADFPEIDTEKGKWKGFKLKIFAGEYKVSKFFMKWVETSETLENADSSVKKEWSRLARNIKGLDRSKVKAKNKLFAELLTKSRYTSSSNWPGSLTPYGQALVSTAHPYLRGTKTFSNYAGALTLLAWTAGEITTSRTNIKTVLGMTKNDLRLQNGDYVEIPSEYTMLVPRELETIAREILNDGSKYSGQGSNSQSLNVFSFEGSNIRLEILDTVGSLDKSGNLIGTTTEWYIYNKEGAMRAAAARFIELYAAEIEMYKNDSNKNYFISIDLSCTVDHYGLEQFIVGANIPNEAGFTS